MKNLRFSHGFAFCLMTLLLAVGASSAFAQDDEGAPVKKEIKVIVDDDGNVTVNGKPVTDRTELDDGTVVMIDEDGKVIVVDDDRGGERIVRRRGFGPLDRERVRVFMRDGDDELEWFGPHAQTYGPDALDHTRQLRFDGMLGEDFDFDFDFEGFNPEIMEMEAAARKLAREASRAQGNEKVQKEQQLTEKLSQIFDRKLESRENRIAKMQERLEKERSELQERREARSQMIERRKSELMGDDTLKW